MCSPIILLHGGGVSERKCLSKAILGHEPGVCRDEEKGGIFLLGDQMLQIRSCKDVTVSTQAIE